MSEQDNQAPSAEVTSTAREPVQQLLPLAFIHGEAMLERPEDLYIPPDALEVILEAFEGPLDLLLYLIRKQKFDILNLPVLQITRQYMEYVEVMRELKLELAAEYLLMAAILAEIKSRLLLPRPASADDDELDPRAELIRRLREYEVVKEAAQDLDQLPRLERDVFEASAQPAPSVQPVRIQPQVSMQELVLSFQQVLKRASAFEHHQIEREALSTRERMAAILEKVANANGQFVGFDELFQVSEGRAGVVVTFLAVLELVKERLIELVQAEPFANIHVKTCRREDEDG